MKRFIPKEFNRKLRPISELSHWKAAELRLFLLYVGVVLLKHQGVLNKARYRHFLKFSVAMRILLSSNTSDEDMPLCSKLLKKFCYDGIQLYGRGFITYNIHSLIHLVDDFVLYGSLDFISCFPFESYLGILKELVKSGYKPLQQIAFHVWHKNANIVENFILKNETDEEFFCPVEEQIDLQSYLDEDLLHYRKAKLSSGCTINTAIAADSTVEYDGKVAKVIDIVKNAAGSKFFVVCYYNSVNDFFHKPIRSSKVGVFLVGNASGTFTIVEFSDRIKKCMLLPFKSKFVCLTLIHSI